MKHLLILPILLLTLLIVYPAASAENDIMGVELGMTSSEVKKIVKSEGCSWEIRGARFMSIEIRGARNGDVVCISEEGEARIRLHFAMDIVHQIEYSFRVREEDTNTAYQIVSSLTSRVLNKYGELHSCYDTGIGMYKLFFDERIETGDTTKSKSSKLCHFKGDGDEKMNFTKGAFGIDLQLENKKLFRKLRKLVPDSDASDGVKF
ncbi:MAG: hypothetical protein ISR48_06375 [Alphaproteobacteria bacterium]|nr:hypothetical protein [Alphaproteobacteria bacterium]